MEMNYKEILEYHNQVYPFLLIDHVDEVVPGVSAKGYKFLNMNDWFFKYHYPDEPLVPGIFMVEAISQMATLAILVLPDLKSKITYLSSIESSKQYLPINPGTIMYIESEIISYKRGIARCRGLCRNGDKLACEAELTFVVPDVLDNYKVRGPAKEGD